MEAGCQLGQEQGSCPKGIFQPNALREHQISCKVIDRPSM